MKEIEKFKKKFRIEEYTIYESDFWSWSLRPVQGTVGAGILSLKRECPVFSEVTEEEFKDLKKIVNIIETTLNNTFHYDVINYLMLMMVDRQVHYHVFPRHKGLITLDKKEYSDTNWPQPPELGGNPVSDDQMNNIYDEIKRNLVK